MIGPVLFVLCCLAIPKSAFPALAERAAIGTVAWMAFWWVTAPIDYAVTAFLPIAINALVTMCDMSAVISNYASETILLLLGASILTVSWEETGLDKRIAASLLGLIGDNLRIQLIFWFMLSTLLSAILPNAVVCATITPIAVSMLKYIGEGDIANSRIGSKLLLYIAYGAGLGGLTSPLGGAMNLVTVDYLQQLTGKEYMYASWVVRFLPIMIVLLLINIIFMIRDVKKGESLGGSREYFKYVASVGVNLSYMLPTSIRAIPVGYGLQPKYMLKEGWKMTVFIIVSMTIVCTLLLKFWPAFSTV